MQKTPKRSLGLVSVWELKDAYDVLSNKKPDKEVAEFAYALALGIKQAADKMGPGFADAKENYYKMARMYAAQCVKVLESLPRNTLGEATVSNTILAGITLPNYFYLEYVLEIPEFRKLLTE